METSTKDQILANVREACNSLIRAGTIATNSNKLAPSVPVIKELAIIGSRLNAIIQEISKLQGL
jgi:hypothetical protein